MRHDTTPSEKNRVGVGFGKGLEGIGVGVGEDGTEEMGGKL